VRRGRKGSEVVGSWELGVEFVKKVKNLGFLVLAFPFSFFFSISLQISFVFS